MKLSISLENFVYRGVLNCNTSDSFMAQILEYLMNEFLDGEKARLGGMGVLSSARKLLVHFFLPNYHHHLNFAVFLYCALNLYETAWNVLNMSTTDRVLQGRQTHEEHTV